MPPSRAVATARVSPAQTAEEIAAAIEGFVHQHDRKAVLREDGKVLFDFAAAGWSVRSETGRCTLHLWNEERNLVRRVLAATPRQNTLQLRTQRFGQAQPRLAELCAGPNDRTATVREAARTRYLKLLERVLAREFAPWKPEGFRTAMDLERSFGPAYARGTLLRGKEAWAVIGVSASETANTIDGVMTLGILWLHECRARAGGRRLYKGLRLLVPQGAAALTHARLPWLNSAAAQWELFELNEAAETICALDPADQGNLRTALVHRPDESRARERFAGAVGTVRDLVPTEEWHRVEQRLRSPTELAFLLHGLQFARARVTLEEASFRHRVEITVGGGAAERPLTPATRTRATEHIAELFRRRQAHPATKDFGAHGLREGDLSRDRRIGSGVLGAAHRRTLPGRRHEGGSVLPSQDPLFRAAPERWLESVLRSDLAWSTRSFAPAATPRPAAQGRSFGRLTGTEDDGGVNGNRADETGAGKGSDEAASGLVPRLDPHHLYSQVPAIAGASDRGMLDLLGVTEDGRLAVIEVKTDDDLHFALQGLDYWIRVREHHGASVDSMRAQGEFQQHGYFADVELAPAPPRLYLVAPALHIHPATETILRYLSPQVEWHLVALDERWRQAVRVVWRKSGAHR